MLGSPKALAQEALGSVALYGASHLAGSGQAETVMSETVGGQDQEEQRAVQAEPAGEDPAEIGGPSESLVGA